MKTALLISTYNWKEALDLIFKSILLQTQMPDEIIIADDGSKEDTKKIIKKFKEKTTVPVQHFWQEDNGFRKATILNKAIAGTTADYIIQIDGDCILHKNFIKDHINAREKKMYLYGSRVNILPQFVTNVIANKQLQFTVFSKEIKNKTRTIHFPFLSKMYQPHKNISKKFRGCNTSFWREDCIKINGYNENFEGWGKEDSDFAIRLGNLGIQAKRLRYAGIVYHIYHKINSKHNVEKNENIEKKAVEKNETYCKNGIDKYL